MLVISENFLSGKSCIDDGAVTWDHDFCNIFSSSLLGIHLIFSDAVCHKTFLSEDNHNVS